MFDHLTFSFYIKYSSRQIVLRMQHLVYKSGNNELVAVVRKFQNINSKIENFGNNNENIKEIVKVVKYVISEIGFVSVLPPILIGTSGAYISVGIIIIKIVMIIADSNKMKGFKEEIRKLVKTILNVIKGLLNNIKDQC